jgi:hypothetical protein
MKRLIFFFLVAALISGCKKEYTGDPLLKYRLKEYTQDSYKYTYQYDSKNRVIKSGTYYDGSLIHESEYFYVNNFLDSLVNYTQNLTLSYETYKQTGDTIYAKQWFIYDTAHVWHCKYVVNDNHIVKKVFPPSIAAYGNTYESDYDVLNWKNDNLIYLYWYNSTGAWSFPVWKSLENTSDYQIGNSVWSTYDDHPNPLKPLYQRIDPTAYESSNNNLLRMAAANNVGDTLFRIFEHTYNQYGLPVTTKETKKYNKPSLDHDMPLLNPVSYYTYTYEEY